MQDKSVANLVPLGCQLTDHEESGSCSPGLSWNGEAEVDQALVQHLIEMANSGKTLICLSEPRPEK